MKAPLSYFLLVAALLSGVSGAVADERSPTFHFQTYDVPGELQTWLTGINDAGTIVGWSLDRQNNAHPFMVIAGKYKQLNVDQQGTPQAINLKGTVVGFHQEPCIEDLCSEAFIYRHGSFKNFGPPWFTTPPEDDSPQSEAYGINDLGVVVGRAGDGFGSEVGFVLKHGNYTELQVLGVNGESAVGINNAGLVTLEWATSTAFGVSLYDGKRYQNISVPDAMDSQGGAINGRGDVVMAFDAGVGHRIHGVLLRDGAYYKFDVPGAKYDTLPLGINDKRTIVGAWGNGQTRIRVHGFIATY